MRRYGGGCQMGLLRGVKKRGRSARPRLQLVFGAAFLQCIVVTEVSYAFGLALLTNTGKNIGSQMTCL